MLKLRNKFLVIIYLSLVLLLEPISYDEIHYRRVAKSQVLRIHSQTEKGLLTRGRLAFVRESPEDERCPPRITGRGHLLQFAKRRLPDQSKRGKLLNDGNSDDEVAWQKSKDNAAFWESAQEECRRETQQLRLGNENPGRGTVPIHKDIKELRGYNGGRVFYRKAKGRVEIVAKSGKDKVSQKAVIK